MRLSFSGPESVVGLIVLSPLIGSFLGVIVRRMPAGRRWAWSRSSCEGCGAALTARDLVPLISWASSRGCCRHCGRRLGVFYPAIELAALAVALVAVGVDGPARAALDCVLGWWLLALGWIDARHTILPDALTLPLIVVGLLASLVFQPEALLDRALGAAVGYVAFVAIAATYRALRGRDGLGGGDAKLLSAAGAWVGATALPEVVLGAALAALSAVGVLRLCGVRLHARSAVAFGPFIAAATWALWLGAPTAFW